MWGVFEVAPFVISWKVFCWLSYWTVVVIIGGTITSRFIFLCFITFPIGRLPMNFPTGFSSVTNLITVITSQFVESPSWIEKLRIRSSGGQGWFIVAWKGLWQDVVLHHDFLSILFSSYLKHASWSNGIGLVLRILIQTSLRFVLSSTQECENLFFFHNFLIFDVVTSTIPFQFFKDVEFLLILGENVEVLGHAEVPLL